MPVYTDYILKFRVFWFDFYFYLSSYLSIYLSMMDRRGAVGIKDKAEHFDRIVILSVPYNFP